MQLKARISLVDPANKRIKSSNAEFTCLKKSNCNKKITDQKWSNPRATSGPDKKKKKIAWRVMWV